MEAPTTDTKLELLCDHYKDSFANIQTALRVRGRLLALLPTRLCLAIQAL